MDRTNILNIVDELNNKVSMHKTIDFELKRITLDDILEKSKDFAVERQLKNRLNDINFMFAFGLLRVVYSFVDFF